MKIEIVEYNPGWAEMYESMKGLFIGSFGDKIAGIEHIGSTSVPGLCAKPIIDILLGVHALDDADSIVPNMIKFGYDYISKYEDEMPYRRYFDRIENGISKFHVHTVVINSSFWNRHIKFRNILRKDEKIKDDYCKLKKDLAKKEWKDANEYAGAKTEFTRRIEKLDYKTL
jgi:GrpB-like predicted nucleotidyltransferase (UPF0157 family)